ncbi:MAG TPA: RNA polymerase factor sigma-54 [Flavipsychrobacter sp.]|nr:RNA polymerase factor sigma-54 [Flavipsychrobacter sp.]
MLSQQQTQKQQLKILPQQIQLLNLYFLNNLELEQRIQNELDENPLLEAADDNDEFKENQADNERQDFQDWEEFKYDDVPDYKAEYQNYFAQEDLPNMPIGSKTHYKDDAKQQLHMMSLSEEELSISEYIIDILNGNGMMDKSLTEVTDDYSFLQQKVVEEAMVEKALAIVQTLEPVGLGARSVQECLAIQLRAMNTKRPDVRCALILIEKHYNDLIHRQFEKIHHALNVDEAELKIILNFIGTLKFYPVTDSNGDIDVKNTIIPDYIITKFGDSLQVSLYNPRAGNVFINQSLYEQLAEQSKKEKGAMQYVRGKLQAAQWFVSAVKQREETMMKIMHTILDLQQEYFKEGDIRLLKPMVLRNVSDISGLDISTISRITSNKYAETPFGLIYLKDLFSEGIADKKGEVISNKVIQSVIQEAIDGEDKKKPYTDQQLVNILSSKGYNIARRTVAKYREQMKIPIAQIRAVWA